MHHVGLFGLILNLVIGVTVATAVHQARQKNTDPFLIPLFYHIIFYTLGVLCLLIFGYIVININEGIGPVLSPLLNETGILMVTVSEVGMVAALLWFNLGLQGIAVPSFWKRILGWTAAVYMIFYGAKYLLPGNSGLFRSLSRFQFEIFDNFLVLEIPILLYFVFRLKKISDPHQKRLSRAAVFLYGARYIIVVLIALIFIFFMPRNFSLRTDPEPTVRIVIYGLALFLFTIFSLIPWLWLRLFYRKYTEHRSSLEPDHSGLHGIVERYRISRREFEILKLLLDGKSNREIKDELYISYHTVKNHVYNLFQKMGVKNRYELIHLASGWDKNESASSDK